MFVASEELFVRFDSVKLGLASTLELELIQWTLKLSLLERDEAKVISAS